MKKQLAVFLLILAIISLGACDNKNKNEAEKISEIQVYYIDTKTSDMISEPYVPIGTTKEQKIEELLQELKTNPKNMLYKSALPENVTIKEFQINKEQLTIDFDTAYNELVGIPEVLCRAAIVKTLSQIEGVELVNFTVNGLPIEDSNGDSIGLMTDEEFVTDTEEVIDYKVSLYFADESGKGLVEADMNINYSGNASIEELVIQQLINGPTEVGMYNTIPEGTTLLNVTTKDGICYVDFNEKFLDKIPDISDDVAIYSVVNTLIDLPNKNINKVQFKINGEVQKTYRESTPFDGFFERNLALINEIQ